LPQGPELVRSIGRFGLVALVLNNIIGTAVFVLPGTIADRLGWASIAAWVVAAFLTSVMILCFSEVASRFSGAGGAYLFTRAAFGPFFGLQMGWLVYFSRAVTAALQANVFAAYLAELWPWAGTRAGALVATTAFIGFLTIVNLKSVRSGARVSSVLAMVKIAPLIAFGALGIYWVIAGQAGPAPTPSNPTLNGWLGVFLLLLFAYGGYESALIPLGEAKDPRRDAPAALWLSLGIVIVVYLATQITVLATLPEPAATSRPLAASVRVILGEPGAVAITVAALISVYGWLATNILTVPRLSMAMAERGDFPAIMSWIHPVTRTPWVSILVFGVLSCVLANLAGTLQNLTLSAVSRLFTYGGVCAALPVLRRKERRGDPAVPPALFPAPMGSVVAAMGVGISLVLTSQMQRREAVILLVVAVLATVYWFARRRSKP
jgi:amino acid transporter